MTLPFDSNPMRDTAGRLWRDLADLSRRVAELEDIPRAPALMASLFLGTGAEQSIGTGAWTEINFDFTSASTWSMGLTTYDGHSGGDGIDKIYVSDIPAAFAIEFSMFIAFASNATGLRGLKLIGSDTTTMQYMTPAVNGDVTTIQAVHSRKSAKASTYFHWQVYQSSGGNLNLSVALVVARRSR